MQPIDIIGPLLTAVVIFAFAAGFLYEAVRVWKSPTPPPENPALTHVWTAVSTLIGGVTAVVLNVEDQAGSGAFAQYLFGPDPKFWLSACTFAYVGVGIAAVTTWVARQPSSTPLIRNASTTFVGLVIPVVAGFLGYINP